MGGEKCSSYFTIITKYSPSGIELCQIGSCGINSKDSKRHAFEKLKRCGYLIDVPSGTRFNIQTQAPTELF